MKAARIHNFGGPLFSRETQLSLWKLSHHSRASPRIAENCRLRNPSRTYFTGVHVEELKQDLASRPQSNA
jgi:hypothetical protein